MTVPTPFHPRTSVLCGSRRWKDWAGYHAVRSFRSCHEPEYHAIRQSAGLLDVSPLFKYEVRGGDAGRFLARVMTRDIRRLRPGRVTYGCLCDEAGKMIDDGTVARLDEDRYRVTTASPALRWLEGRRRRLDVSIEDESERLAAVALQGPRARHILAAIAEGGVDKLRYFAITKARIGKLQLDISRTGYTGDLGYELWVDRENALPLWDALIEAGGPHRLLPVGLDALDVVRIEAGYILQGVDYFSAPRCAIEERKSSPLEAGLGWTVDLERESFIGQEALRDEMKRGSRWALVGIEVDAEELESLYDRYGLPPELPAGATREGVPIFRRGRQVGQATSSTWSPLLKRFIALATVKSRCSAAGTRLEVEHTVEYCRHRLPCLVVDRPFFDPPRKRA
ncbi:MAG: aminomethyltransferase family protein [Planctomycetota bacterium]